MATHAGTKIFGMRIGLDPKVIVGALIGLAGILFWYNTRSADDLPAPSTAAVHRDIATSTAPVVRSRPAAARRSRNANDNGTLRLTPIDPTRGDVDPTLRLDLLARLQRVEADAAGRSLFEAAPPPMPAPDQNLLKHPPVVPKAPPPPPSATAAVAAEPPLNIPLKYYGFAKEGDNTVGNQGLFLDGDNVVVGAEGQVVLKHYVIVSLTPNAARLEDTQLKRGQTLPVIPAAIP